MADPISFIAQEKPVAPTQDQVLRELERPGIIDTAAAFWRRESLIGSALAEIGLGEDPAAAEYDPDFNPYAHFMKNREALADLEPWLRKGAFDRANNEADFNRIATRIRMQLDDMRTIEEGSGWGLALGMGLSILDVTSLIPFAKAKSATAVANALRVGGSGAALAAGQEVALHAMQPTRTAEETFWNIGATTALAGGLGVFSSVLHPHSPLNPKNNPPLTGNETHPIGSALPGMTREEADVIGSVGAARAGVQAGTEIVTGGPVSRAALKVGQWLSSMVSPTGRATLWSSQVGRDKAIRMFDLGGIFTRHMEEGVAHHAAAEDIFRDHMLSLYEINQELVDGFRQMQMDLGLAGSVGVATVKSDINLALNAFGGPKRLLNTGISEDEFQEIVRRKVTNTFWQQGGDWKLSDVDGAYFRNLMTEAGLDEKAAAVIEKATDRVAKVIQRKALEQEEKMFRAGMITEDQRLGVRYGLAQLWDKSHTQLNKEELRGLLLELFRKRPDEQWLLDTHGLSLEDWQKLPDRATKEVGPDGKSVEKKGRLDILEEWVGDDAAVQLERARAAFDEAHRAYQEALSVHQWAKLGVDLGKAEHSTLKLGEVKAHIRASEAQNALDRLELHAQRVRLLEERVENLRRKIVAGEGVERAGDRVIEGFEAVQRITGVLDEATAKGNLPAAENLMALYERAVNDLAAAKARLDDHMKRLNLADPAKVEAALKRAREGELVTEARLDERLRAVDAQEARVKVLNERLDEAVRKRKEAWAQYELLRKGAKEAGIEARAARKDLNAAKRQLKRVEKKAAILEVVDEIVDAIADEGRAPNGLIREIGESARVKDRRIILTNEERRLFEERGFLHTDLQYVLDRQYRDISARLALREAFGEESLKATFKEIEADYDKLIKANPAKAEKLKDELIALKKDLLMGRDRLLGIAGRPDDPDSLAMWGLNKLRQMTYLRFAAGFVVSSLTDLATHVLHNGFGRETHAAAKRFYQILKTAGVSPESKELRVLMLAAEMSMAHSTASRQFLLNEAVETRGVGHGLYKKVTSLVDRPLNTIQSRMNAWTLMGPYNAFVKGVSGLMLVNKLATKLGKYDSLSKLEKAELASLGIGREEAQQLDRFFKKYGTNDEYGFHANAFEWTKEQGGDEAARVLRVALRRHMDRSSPTPGIGDSPLAMSKPLGQVLLQFQAYGFASVNRVLLPALQRGLVYNDARVVGWMGSLVGLATLVATIRAYQNGKDPHRYSSKEWMREVVDRGGLLFYLSPYVDAVDKATGIPFGGGGLSSRYRNNKWWHSLLGPSFGTLDAIGHTGTSLMHGDMTRAREKGLLLLPFNQVWRLGNAFINELSD